MAVDSRDKRASAIAPGSPWRGLLPLPNSDVVAGDRAQLVFLYRGLVSSLVQAYCVIATHTFSAGAAAAEAFNAGAAAEHTFSAGGVLAQSYNAGAAKEQTFQAGGVAADTC